MHGVTPLGVAIIGITGRMGQSLVRCLTDTDGNSGAAAGALILSGAVAGPASHRLGHDAAANGPPSGIVVTADLDAGLRGAAVAVDFSRPQSLIEHAAACAQAKVPLLVGTTGWDTAARDALDEAARAIPVLIAPNTSVGVGVMAQLVALAAAALGPDYDVEILEAHHRFKRDAPSGTALALGTVVAAARGANLQDLAVYERHGSDSPRRAGGIGFSVLRGGDIVGEHTVVFAGSGERIEITHRATDRATFAHGALRAAAWLSGQPAGLYAMKDVLGMDSHPTRR